MSKKEDPLSHPDNGVITIVASYQIRPPTDAIVTVARDSTWRGIADYVISYEVRTADAAIREALIALGWTPPKEKKS